jgi:hypothetical protein
MVKSGKHLACVRSWIQRKFINGERVTWGSNDVCGVSGLTVLDLEGLAQDIRDAVLKEFNIKDNDHEYKYVAHINGPNECDYKEFDNREELWNILGSWYQTGANIYITKNGVEDIVFEGNFYETMKWSQSL